MFTIHNIYLRRQASPTKTLSLFVFKARVGCYPIKGWGRWYPPWRQSYFPWKLMVNGWSRWTSLLKMVPFPGDGHGEFSGWGAIPVAAELPYVFDCVERMPWKDEVFIVPPWWQCPGFGSDEMDGELVMKNTARGAALFGWWATRMNFFN